MPSSVPKWSLLIPTVVDRPQYFERLRDRLAPQVAAAKGQVEVVVFWNNYERQIGKIRQLMLEDARGEYLNFIDDDDLVVEDYIETILPLLDGVDYVGFMVDFYVNGTKVEKPVIHSLTCSGWYNDAAGFYRRAVHTNPVKSDLARQYAHYDQSDYTVHRPEEIIYHDNISLHLKTEHYIPRPMHIYEQTDSHAWGKFTPENGIFTRPVLPKYFRFHKGSTR